MTNVTKFQEKDNKKDKKSVGICGIGSRDCWTAQHGIWEFAGRRHRVLIIFDRRVGG